MDILEQLGAKVKSAVQEIEKLKARVAELEEINAQYEQKTQEMMDVMKQLDETTESDDDTTESAVESSTTSSYEAPSQERQDIYRQQY